MEPAYLIVGLGNPGRDYARTRHNAGFMLTDRLLAEWGAAWREERAFTARLARAKCAGRTCWLCQPLTYMNASGEAVKAVMSYYRLEAERLLVVVDDADLALGTVRMRPDGSSGGHHGLESVEQHLGTRGYARLRLGIGRRDDQGRQITGHVLGAFSPEEAQWFGLALDRAAEAVACWIESGVTAAMNRFNGAVTPPEPREAK